MAELADWRPEVLVVVGGTLWETERAPDIRALLNEQFQRGATGRAFAVERWRWRGPAC